MKLIVDIPEEQYNDIVKYLTDNDGNYAYSDFNLREIIRNGKPYNPSGDCISREALREKAETITLWNGDVRRFVSYETIDNAPTVKPCENCDLYFKAMTKEEMRKGGADNEHL